MADLRQLEARPACAPRSSAAYAVARLKNWKFPVDNQRLSSDRAEVPPTLHANAALQSLAGVHTHVH